MEKLRVIGVEDDVLVLATETGERFGVPVDEVLLEPTRIAYETSLPGFGDRPTARFTVATLGNDAGLVGVADLAGLRSR